MAAACVEENDVVGGAKRYLWSGRELNPTFLLLDCNNDISGFAGGWSLHVG